MDDDDGLVVQDDADVGDVIVASFITLMHASLYDVSLAFSVSCDVSG